jgi:hypothetical protein
LAAEVGDIENVPALMNVKLLFLKLRDHVVRAVPYLSGPLVTVVIRLLSKMV